MAQWVAFDFKYGHEGVESKCEMCSAICFQEGVGLGGDECDLSGAECFKDDVKRFEGIGGEEEWLAKGPVVDDIATRSLAEDSQHFKDVELCVEGDGAVAFFCIGEPAVEL